MNMLGSYSSAVQPPFELDELKWDSVLGVRVKLLAVMTVAIGWLHQKLTYARVLFLIHKWLPP